MSKVRIPINPKQVGKVGAYTMYVRAGEQIVRQRQNASNYGESAKRTYAQQDRRARWGNLVNAYKAMKFWQPKAWEALSAGVTDYNAFMGSNANTTPIYLTKDMVANGCAVMDNFLVSKGSLVPIDGSWDAADQAFTTNIVTSAVVSAETTVAQFSQDILSGNPTFQNGDNIAYIRFEQQFDDRGYPYLQSLYEEFTIDTSNTSLLSTLPIYSLIKTDNPNNLFFDMAASPGWTSVGAVAIHTRRSNGLKVSTQQMVVINTSFIAQFSGNAARQAAIESYGVDADVPLEPSFSGAVISSVTANGSVVNAGSVYASVQELVVTGQKMAPTNVRLYKDDEYFTPLEVDMNSWKYILGQQGRYRLYVNGSVYVEFSIGEIAIPDGLTGSIRVAQRDTPGLLFSNAVNSRSFSNGVANYPFLATSSLQWFVLAFFSEGVEYEAADWTIQGGTLGETGYDSDEGSIRLTVTPTGSGVVTIFFRGNLVAVLNYSA